jgi:nanoRNase/pAp phosphatase (c-di-AMP/oligoRNAs hydrolase)
MPAEHAVTIARDAGTSEGRAAELGRLMDARRGERHVVALQDFPDPDAIACGLAYAEIAARYGIEADLVYAGQISHPENRALVNLLDIPLRAFEGEPLDGYSAAVFVDNQGATTRLTDRLKADGVGTFAVIDHHEPADVLDPIFSDVRPLGAAATILTEYLASGLLVELEPDSERHTRLATALMHGLHSETDGFVRARAPEYRAAAFLSRFMNPDLLERVVCVQKSRASLRVIEHALRSRTVRNGLSVAGVGYVRWPDRDAIAVAADFLLTEENVRTSVVYGLLELDDGREAISGSLRTLSSTMRVDGFLRAALGDDLRGRPYGGGRSRAGGFEIELGFLKGDGDDPVQRRLKWALYDRRIRRRLFGADGVEELDDVCDRSDLDADADADADRTPRR